jgi:hypothetical protein
MKRREVEKKKQQVMQQACLAAGIPSNAVAWQAIDSCPMATIYGVSLARGSYSIARGVKGNHGGGGMRTCVREWSEHSAARYPADPPLRPLSTSQESGKRKQGNTSQRLVFSSLQRHESILHVAGTGGLEPSPACSVLLEPVRGSLCTDDSFDATRSD